MNPFPSLKYHNNIYPNIYHNDYINLPTEDPLEDLQRILAST